jgi:hypothetical protein
MAGVSIIHIESSTPGVCVDAGRPNWVCTMPIAPEQATAFSGFGAAVNIASAARHQRRKSRLKMGTMVGYMVQNGEQQTQLWWSQRGKDDASEPQGHRLHRTEKTGLFDAMPKRSRQTDVHAERLSKPAVLCCVDESRISRPR